MAALDKADEVRIYRANLKRDIKAGRTSIYDILLDPPDLIETMKLIDLMLAVPKYGRVRVDSIMKICTISSSKKIGMMSLRQRMIIVSMLRR